MSAEAEVASGLEPRRLVLAGFQDSGRLHWQSLWSEGDARYVKLAHASWDAPNRHDWVQDLEAAMPGIGSDTVIVAHSLGCLLTAFWAAQTRHRLRGAFLVAPPNPARADSPPAITHFRDPPRTRLPFPSVVIGSDDDPCGSLDYMAGLAADWGSRFQPLSGVKHIGTLSRVGRWPAGKALLEEFIAGLPPAARG
jgi:predicted alpha/beta hydrolase family esterase